MNAETEKEPNFNTGRITVVMVSWFSHDYISRLIDNLKEKAARPERLGFLLIDNTNGEDPDICHFAENQENIQIEPLNCGLLRGSEGHGFGLNHAFTRLSSPYTLVVDPDVHVFKHHWDDFLIDELQKESALAIGAPYPFWRLGNYHDFPSPAFLFFNTNAMLDHDPDWTPFPVTRFGRLCRFFPRQLVRMGFICTRKNLIDHSWLRWMGQTLEKIFGVCDPDTGWLIAGSVRKSGARVLLLREATENDPAVLAYGEDSAMRDLAREYELYFHKGQPLVAHKYSTYSLHFRTAYGNNKAYWWERLRRADTLVDENNRLPVRNGE